MVIGCALFLGTLGVGLNIYKLITECDYESPYKCEAVRAIGLAVPFIGGVVGFMDFDETS